MKVFCRFCGQFSDIENQFCPDCGYKLDVRSFAQSLEKLNGITVTFIKSKEERDSVPSKNKKVYIRNITAYREWSAIYNEYKRDYLSWKIENGALVLGRETGPESSIKCNNELEEYWIQLTDAMRGMQWEFRQPKIIVGRDFDCDLRSNNGRVSRHHAEIFYQEMGWHILDANSTNGTTLNGEKMEKNKAYLLTFGDAIGLPDGTIYVFKGCNFANSGKRLGSSEDSFDDGCKIPDTVIYREYLRYEQYDKSNRVKYWMETPCDHKCSLKELTQDERRVFLKWLVSTPPHATEKGDLDFTLSVS